ncbi:hypothetical protein POF51_26350 [Brevibacillus sp. AG]|uniref:hypothetical protein n=1 Tax=Brevibacillus sp. AG TaxID=3020891 RepID=UPI00232C6890|nr:hypothetical protein [Brevibacillus sp. AG]MDC0764245.1 hypothetical protein [Brevibacillus sp. AG]
MNVRSRWKKLLATLLAISLAAGGVLFNTPTPASAIDANKLNLNLAELDSKGRPIGNDFDRVKIAGPSLDQDSMIPTIQDVEINGTKQGTAVNYSYEYAVSDNGHLFGTLDEAKRWTELLNGNPSYVNGGSSGAYGHVISNKGSEFKNMKNLAEVAIASGGWGKYDHSAIYPLGNGKYRRIAKFYTTERPTREVKTDKTTYQPNETVKITTTATDFSKYNKGIEVLNLSVINKSTSRGYKQYSEVMGFHADSSGRDEPFVWNGKVLEYKPPAGGHEPGTYEVQFLIVDSKKRANREASSISAATPAIATFTIGGAPPVLACANIKFHSGTKVSDPVVSSGSTQLVTTGDVARFFAETNGKGVKGDWKVEGYSAFDTNNSATFNFTVPNSPGEIFKITFKLAGTNETCLTIYVKADMQGSIPCPPSDSSKAEKMDILHKLNSGSSESTYYSLITPHATAIASVKVASQYMNSKVEKVTIKPSNGGGGSWYVDGAPAKASAVISGGQGLLISEYAISISDDDSMTFKVEFRGNNGKVWCYNITLTTEKKSKPADPSCFEVHINYIGGKTIASGTTLHMTNKIGRFDFHVVYHNGRDANQRTNVNWEVEYPDGTVKPWPLMYDDKKDKMRPHRTDNFVYEEKMNAGLNKGEQVWFKTPGTYKIRHDGHEWFKEYKDIECPSWEITIVIVEEPEPQGCEGFTVEVEVDGSKREFSGGTGTPADPFILNVNRKEVATFNALYNGQPSVKVYWFLKSAYGNSGRTETSFSYEFYQSPAEVPDGFLLTMSRKSPDQGGDICYTFKIVWGDPPDPPSRVECDDLYIRASVDGRFVDRVGEGTAASPYKLRLTSGATNNVEFFAFRDTSSGSGTTKGIDSVKWELVSSKGTDTSSSNPFTKRFSDTSAITYTLKATIKIKGITCIKYMEITVAQAGCDDLYLHMWNSQRNMWANRSTPTDEHYKPDEGMGFVISDDGKIDIKLAVTNSIADPTPSTRLKVTWTAINKTTGETITNSSSNPSVLFEKNGLSSGIYVIKAKVTDTRFPALLDCEIAIKAIIKSRDGGCDALYLHVFEKFDGVWKERVVDSGTTLTYPTAPDVIQFFIWDSANLISENRQGGEFVVEAEWTTSPPMESQMPAWAGFSPKEKLTEGSYIFTAKINDSEWVSAKDCQYTVTVVIGQDEVDEPPPCTTCEPGGEIPGGKMNMKVYDSDNRLLSSTADGTWEKEPARIEVEINQSQIDMAFASVDREIAQAIVDKQAYFEAKYPAPDYENVIITPNPTSWNAKASPMTRWPSSVPMTVNGPGVDQNFTLNPKLPVQSNIYTGTTVPTLTTWNVQLNAEDYMAEADSFTIEAPYKVEFRVSYEKCVEKKDPKNPKAPSKKECSSGTDQDSIQNTFTITIDGVDTKFEVYEPNAKGNLLHTPEWIEKHSRDRYTSSTNNSYYAGETILTHMVFEPRHKHPFSNQYPVILSATSWMQEQGGKNTDLRNSLNLVKVGMEWHGPSIEVPKLGRREEGVDTLKMGDVWSGLQRGNYSVYFLPRFKFGVDKGYPVYDKSQLRGHNMDDYKVPLEILGNAYEWQGYKTHYR